MQQEDVSMVEVEQQANPTQELNGRPAMQEKEGKEALDKKQSHTNKKASS